MAGKSTAVVDYQKILTDLAGKQQKAAAALSSGSTFASFRGAQLTLDGAAVPGNKVNIVVLSTMQERAYYEGDFDPDNKTTPICYAFGEVNGGAPIAPHANSSQPQSGTCKDCEHAQFGSAVRGRGQACRQSQRIAFIASDGKTEGDSQIYQAKVPPTSLKNVKGWLDEIGARNLATAQVVTELSVTPDPKNQLQVHLRSIDQVKPGILGTVVPRIAPAERTISEPYPEFEETTTKRKPAKKAAAKKRKF